MSGGEREEAARRVALARQMLASVAPCRHGPGFGCCWWYGTYYTFSAAQARVVAVLWDAWLNDTPDVRQEVLLEAAGSESGKIAYLFRDHPAWGGLIVAGPSKGLYHLADPSPHEKAIEAQPSGNRGAPEAG